MGLLAVRHRLKKSRLPAFLRGGKTVPYTPHQGTALQMDSLPGI